MKTVLITGSSRGIGRALALAFAHAGYAVAVNFLSEEDKAAEVVQAILKAGGQAQAFQCNVRDSLRVREMVEAVIQKWGTLDVLINNAGLTRDRTILKMTIAEWNDVVDTNLNGAFWCIREAARKMSEKKSGSIINIASIMAVRGGYGNSNYAASKAGLIALTKTAARELGRFHISVNAVLPGFHQTDMASELSVEQIQKVISEHALGHSTQMQDLTSFIVNLAANQSISGQVMTVDSRIL